MHIIDKEEVEVKTRVYRYAYVGMLHTIQIFRCLYLLGLFIWEDISVAT